MFDDVVEMVIGLNIVNTFVLRATNFWLLGFICNLVYAVLSLHEVSGLSRNKQFGIFVNVSFSGMSH
jgi:hypothetical protein